MARWAPRLPGRATWRRWELVRVEEEAGALVLDVLEVLDRQGPQVAEPLTICVVPAPTGDDGEPGRTLHSTLNRWMERDDGICDVLRHGDDPYDFLALFQGAESVVLATVDD